MNLLFQTLWLIVKPFIARTSIHCVADFAGQMIAQLKLARFFGGVKLVFVGDSNAAGFRPKRFMTSFRSIVCNIAIEGTTADQWYEFFLSDEGKAAKELMGDAVVVFSIGGNHVIQKKMDVASGALKSLFSLFPESYNIVVPTIHYSLLSILGISEDEAKLGVAQINQIIRGLWRSHAIDIVAPMEEISGLSFSVLLRDVVHYGNVARVALINTVKAVTGIH